MLLPMDKFVYLWTIFLDKVNPVSINNDLSACRDADNTITQGEHQLMEKMTQTFSQVSTLESDMMSECKFPHLYLLSKTHLYV